MAEFLISDEHHIFIRFNNSHARNHFKKEIEKLLKNSEAML